MCVSLSLSLCVCEFCIVDFLFLQLLLLLCLFFYWHWLHFFLAPLSVFIGQPSTKSADEWTILFECALLPSVELLLAFSKQQKMVGMQLEWCWWGLCFAWIRCFYPFKRKEKIIFVTFFNQSSSAASCSECSECSELTSFYFLISYSHFFVSICVVSEWQCGKCIALPIEMFVFGVI